MADGLFLFSIKDKHGPVGILLGIGHIIEMHFFGRGNEGNANDECNKQNEGKNEGAIALMPRPLLRQRRLIA